MLGMDLTSSVMEAIEVLAEMRPLLFLTLLAAFTASPIWEARRHGHRMRLRRLESSVGITSTRERDPRPEVLNSIHIETPDFPVSKAQLMRQEAPDCREVQEEPRATWTQSYRRQSRLCS